MNSPKAANPKEKSAPAKKHQQSKKANTPKQLLAKAKTKAARLEKKLQLDKAKTKAATEMKKPQKTANTKAAKKVKTLQKTAKIKAAKKKKLQKSTKKKADSEKKVPKPPVQKQAQQKVPNTKPGLSAEGAGAHYLAATVHNAVKQAAQSAANLADSLGVTKPEKQLMVWQAESTKKQEVLESALHHSQRAALRHAVEDFKACIIRQQVAKKHAAALAARANEDDLQQKSALQQVNAATAKDAKVTAFKMWKMFKDEASKSMAAAEQAQKQVATLQIECTKAKLHQEHVGHLITRAAAHLEHVRAKLVSEYEMRKNKLRLQVETAKEQRLAQQKKMQQDQEMKAELSVFKQKLEEERELHKWEHKVSLGQQKVTKGKQALKDAKMALKKEDTQLKSEHKELKRSQRSFGRLNAKLNSLLDAAKHPAGKQNRKELSRRAKELQQVASKLTVAAKLHKRLLNRVASIKHKMQHMRAQVENADEKLYLLSQQLEGVQSTLALKKFVWKQHGNGVAENELFEIPQKIDVMHSKTDVMHSNDQRAKAQKALNVAEDFADQEKKEAIEAVAAASVAEAKAEAAKVAAAAKKEEVEAEVDEEAHGDRPVIAMIETLAPHEHSKQSAKSTAVGDGLMPDKVHAVLTAAERSRVHNIDMVKQGLRDLHAAEESSHVNHMLLSRLAEMAKNVFPAQKGVRSAHADAPPTSLIAEEMSISPVSSRRLEDELHKHTDAAKAAKEVQHKHLVVMEDTEVLTHKAGDTAAVTMAAAANAQYKARQSARKATQALATAKLRHNKKMKQKALALGRALRKEANSLQREAVFALEEEESSVAESKAQVKAHEEAKAAAAAAAQLADQEAYKAKTANDKLALFAAAQQQEATHAAAEVEAGKKALKVLKMKKKLVRRATTAHLKRIDAMLSKATTASSQMEKSAGEKLSAKVEEIQARLKQRLKLIHNSYK